MKSWVESDKSRKTVASMMDTKEEEGSKKTKAKIKAGL